MTKRRMRIQIGLGSVVAATLVLGLMFTLVPHKARVSANFPTLPQEVSGDFDKTFRFGVAALGQGRPEDALVAFEEAAKMRNDVPQVYVNLGFALLEMDRAMDAATAFHTAIDLKPGQANAYYGLGEALEAAGDMAGALGAMRSFTHLTGEEDPFHRKALSAIWELETRMGAGVAPAGPIVPLKATIENLEQYDRLLERNRGRVVIVNVWATWCGPCRAELASLQALAGKLRQSEAVVIGVSVDDTPTYVLEFLNDLNIHYKNYIDKEGTLSRERFDITSYPQTLLFDRGGKLVETISGARDWASDDVTAKIQDLYKQGEAS